MKNALHLSLVQEETGGLKQSENKNTSPLPPPRPINGMSTSDYFGDLQLARQAQTDPPTEEAVLRRVYPKIRQVVRITVSAKRHQDDIAQLAVMEVAKSLGRYRGLGSLEAWAGRIAYRVAMKTIKRHRKKEVGMVPLWDEDLPNKDTPEKLISRRQLFERLLSKMDSIPTKRRVPLLLRLAYGYSVKEVAALTDASPNTVKDRLKTAFRELQGITDRNQGLLTAMFEELP